MSLQMRYEEQRETIEINMTETCFLCGKKIRGDNWVTWMGYEGGLYLHPRCASELGQHLIRDAMSDPDYKTWFKTRGRLG